MIEPNKSGKDFDQFFLKNYQMVLLVCASIVNDRIAAEDIAQEVFITLWEKRDTLKFDDHLIPYLRKSARNKSFNYIRDTKDFVDINKIKSPTDESYDNEKEERLVQLTQQISQLPPQCQKVFRLVALKGFSYEQAAAKMELSKNTIKSQMKKAFSFLRKKNR